MGGFQYLEATLSLQVSLWPGFSIYPGSSVMFTTNLFAVLLVYMKEDALEARKLVYGLVLANAGLTLVSLLVSAHFLFPGNENTTSMTARASSSTTRRSRSSERCCCSWTSSASSSSTSTSAA